MDVDAARRHELAGFLRSRRDRLAPESVGLASVGRRRAPGLRREEVAQLAGVGVTWYTWLEQGRPIKVSAQVLGAIANALRLHAEERDHLFDLAGEVDPGRTVAEDDLVAGSIRTILERVDPLPACVISARYDILAWNRPIAAVMGDFGKLPPERRNTVWLLFTEPVWQRMFPNYEIEAGMQCVARLRRNFAAHLGEPHWQGMVDELCEVSPEFKRLWDRHDVAGTQMSHHKRFDHPLVGRLELASTSLWVADQPGTRVVVYTPLDQRGRDAIEELRAGEPWIPWTRSA